MFALQLNSIHTNSTGQSTHQDSVKKILSVGHLISVSFLVYQFIGLVYQFFSIENDYNLIFFDHTDTIFGRNNEESVK